MIKSGDKFTVIELQQSVNEVVNTDISAHTQVFNTLKLTPQDYATFKIGQYADVKSSATKLDDQLKKRGFKTTFRFSYNYKTPGLTSEQIVNDAYKLEYFQNLMLNFSPKEGHTEKLCEIINNAFRVSYYYAQYLWACNPTVCGNLTKALKYPGPQQWTQIISTILGIGFNFHPNDVYEFAIEHMNPSATKQEFDRRYAEQLEFKQLCRNGYGIDTGCLVLSPENRIKLYKILAKSDTPYLIQVLQNLLKKKHR